MHSRAIKANFTGSESSGDVRLTATEMAAIYAKYAMALTFATAAKTTLGCFE